MKDTTNWSDYMKISTDDHLKEIGRKFDSCVGGPYVSYLKYSNVPKESVVTSNVEDFAIAFMTEFNHRFYRKY